MHRRDLSPQAQEYLNNVLKMWATWTDEDWRECRLCKSSYARLYMVGDVCKGCKEAPL